jgi:hypothetical protein
MSRSKLGKTGRRPSGGGAEMSTSGRIIPERELDIAELAEEVADTHCPGSRVDPLKIIEANGITLSFGRHADALDGLLEYQRGQFHIYSNLDRAEDPKTPRARFTPVSAVS